MKINLIKKSVFFILAGVLVLSLGLWNSIEAADKVLRFGVGRVGGTYYVMGGGIAEIIKKNIPGYTAEITTTTGSEEALRGVETKQLELGMAPSSTLWDAKEGLADFQKEGKFVNIRQVLNLHMNVWSPMVLKGSDIKKFEDLKGKFVAIPSSGALVLFRDYLKAYRMKIEDLKWQYLPYGKAADALQDKKVDMVWFHVGIPNSTAEELAHKADIRVLELDEWAAENLVKEVPFYSIGVLPKGTYRGVDRDIRAGEIVTTLYCHKDQAPEFTYQLCKSFYGNLDYMGTVHPSARQIKVEQALAGKVFAFHPGAEKYYKEIGLLK